jgi:hypothetical protein
MLTGDTVCSWCLQSKVILDQPKEARDFLGRRVTNLMMCQNSTLLRHLKVNPTQGRKDTRTGSLLGIAIFSGGLRAI